jgi:hypothetical protein
LFALPKLNQRSAETGGTPIQLDYVQKFTQSEAAAHTKFAESLESEALPLFATLTASITKLQQTFVKEMKNAQLVLDALQARAQQLHREFATCSDAAAESILAKKNAQADPWLAQSRLHECLHSIERTFASNRFKFADTLLQARLVIVTSCSRDSTAILQHSTKNEASKQPQRCACSPNSKPNAWARAPARTLCFAKCSIDLAITLIGRFLYSKAGFILQTKLSRKCCLSDNLVRAHSFQALESRRAS